MQDNKNEENEQTIQEQLKIIQEDNYSMFYKPGNFVDVRFHDTWEVGRIEKEDKGSVLVTSFVDQSKKGQFYKSDPHKISRFRKNTKSMIFFRVGQYQLKTILNLFTTSITNAQKLILAIQNNEEVLFYDIYNTLHGSLFYIFELALRSSISDNKEFEMLFKNLVILLTDVSIKILTYITNNSDILNEYVIACSKKNDDIMLFKPKMAIISFLHEIIVILFTLFGRNNFFSNFFIEYKGYFNSKFHKLYQEEKIMKHCNQEFYSKSQYINKVPTIIIAGFIDLFYNQKGFHLLHDILKQVNTFDISIFYNTLSIFDYAAPLLDYYKLNLYKESMVLTKYVCGKIETLPNEQLITYSKQKNNWEHIERILCFIYKTFKINEKDKDIIPLASYLRFIVRTFQCTPLEIQFVIIEEINSMIHKVQRLQEIQRDKINKQEKSRFSKFALKISSILQGNFDDTPKQEEKPTVLAFTDLNFYCKCLEDVGFINELLSPSLNEGVFSISLFIFQTMYNHLWRNYDSTKLQDIRDKLWQKTIGENSEGKIEIHNSMKAFISNFIMDLSYQHKEYFFSPLKQFIIDHGMNNDNLNFLTSLTLNCLEKDNSEEIQKCLMKITAGGNSFNIYGMDLIWTYIINGDKQNQNSINQSENVNEYSLFEETSETKNCTKEDKKINPQEIELMNQCVESFYKIINHKNVPDLIRKKIIGICFDHKHLNKSITQIYFLITLLLKDKTYSNMYYSALNAFNKDSLKINEFVLFIKTEIIDYLALIPSNNLIDEEIIYQGIYPYSESIRKRIELILLFFNKQSPANVNYDIFSVIWIACQKEPKAKNFLFECLSKSIPSLKVKILEEFNSQIIQKDFQVESFSSYLMIKQLVIQINISKNLMYPISDTDYSLFKVTALKSKLEGIETFWNLLISKEISNEIKEDIIMFLTHICVNILDCNPNKLNVFKIYWSTFYQMLVESLQKVVEKTDKDENIIHLLLMLIKKISTSYNNSIILRRDQTGSIISTIDEIPKGKNYVVLFKKANTKTEKRLPFTSKTKFTEILNLLSFFFRLPRDMIECTIKKEGTKPIIINSNNETAFFYDLLNINNNTKPTKDNYNQKSKNSNETEIINLSNITIVVKERTHPIHDLKQKPHEYLFYHSGCMSLLQELLKDTNAPYMKTIWFLFQQNNFSQNEDEGNYIKQICSLYEVGINENEKSKIEMKFDFAKTNVLYISLVIAQLKYVINKYKDDISFLKELFIKGYAWKQIMQPYFMNYSLLTTETIQFEDINEKIKILNNMISIHYNLLTKININDISDSKTFFDKIIHIIKELNTLSNELNKNKTLSFSFKKEIDNLIDDCITNIFNLLRQDNVIISVINYMYSSESLNVDIINLSFTLSSVQIQKAFHEFIINIVELYNNLNIKEHGEIIKRFVQEIMKYFLKDSTLNTIEALANESKTIKTFNLFYSMLSSLISQISIIDTENEIRNGFENLINNYFFTKIFPTTNPDNKLSDLVLGGYLNIIYSILKQYPTIKLNQISLQNDETISLADILLNSLFTSKCNDTNRKTKLPILDINLSYTKQYAYSLLVLLTFSDPLKRKQIIDQLNSYHKTQFWKKENDTISWKLLSNKDTEDKISRNVGIKNLGCTCYINSLVQTFFSIKTFRDALLSCECSNDVKNSLFQLKKLFLNLEHTQKEYIDTSEFCKNFDNQVLNPKEQMDIDEFFITLLDKIEQHLQNTSNADLVKYFFESKNMDELIFKDACDNHRKNEFSCYSTQLQVKDKNNIFESLDTLIEEELMDGDNKIFCEYCNSKHTAVKRQSFLKLPRMLMFVLKRFEFNYLTGQKIKLNDYFEFPVDLDMTKYTTEYIRSENKEEYLATNQTNNQYRLKAVVIHIGNSEGGHYYVFIRDDKTNEWNEFNDTKVNEFDINELKKEAFGGFETRTYMPAGEEKVKSEQVEIIKNAYLVFYEKVEQSNCQQYEKVSLEKKHFDDTNILDDIHDDSKSYNIEKILFSREYHTFIITYMLNTLMLLHDDENAFRVNLFTKTKNQKEISLYSQIQRTDLVGSNLSFILSDKKMELFSQHKQVINEKDRNKELLDLFKFYIIYFFNVALRTKKEENFALELDMLKYILNYSEECSQYLIEEFYNRTVIDEYLFDCPDYDIKKIIVGIIYCAMISLSNKYARTTTPVIDINQPMGMTPNTSNKDNFQIHPCLIKFIDNIMHIIGTIHSEIIDNNISVLFHILFRFSLIDDKHKMYLIQKHSLERYLKSLSYAQHNAPIFISQYCSLTYNPSKHYILESCFVSIDQMETQNIRPTNNIHYYIEDQNKRENKTRVYCYQYLIYYSIIEIDKFANQIKGLSDEQIYDIFTHLFDGLITRQSALYLKNIITILSKDNKYVTNILIEVFRDEFRRLLQKSTDYFKLLFIVFKDFIFISDNLKSKRFDNISFLIKIIDKIQHYDRTKLVGDFLLDLFIENPVYFESSISKLMKQLYEFMTYFYQRIIDDNVFINENHSINVWKLKYLYKRLDQNPKGQIFEMDKDKEKEIQEEMNTTEISHNCDLTDYKFFFDDKIKIMHEKPSYKVINITDEMIYLETINKNNGKFFHKWIMTDDVKLIVNEPNPIPCHENKRK